MKLLIYTPALALLFSLASCVNVPDLDPSSNSSMIVTEIDINGFFSQYQHFNKSLDINGNGTTDFYFKGRSEYDAEQGMLHSVTLIGAQAENKSISKTLTDRSICDRQLPNFPISVLQPNFIVSPMSKWNNSTVFYESQISNDGCSGYNKHVNYEEDLYIGLRFKENEQTFFGWLRIKAKDLSSAGLVQCADQYTIDQCAYNANPDQSVRIPA